MKLAAIVMLASCLAASAHGVSQQVTITENKAPLEKVFELIKKQTGYTFFYQPKVMEGANAVTIDVRNVPLEDALKLCFKNQLLSYRIIGKVIAVKKTMPVAREGKLLIPSATPEQIFRIEITGKVVDEKGQPLPGATIQIGTVTVLADLSGVFTIEAGEKDVLKVSYIGFKTREYKLSGKTDLLIVLQREEISLDTNIVVYSTGFQHIPKERATGSFVQIDNKTLNRTVSTNILDRLYYTAAGLRKGLNGFGGGYGNSSEISIRGVSTVIASQKPLIVVDGFPYEESDYLSRTPSLVANLNPNDVESVTILKDAAAASIWGARSANGVIVINTKSGKYNQKLTVGLRSSTNYIERPRLFMADIMSSKDFIAFEKSDFNTGMYNDYDDVYPGLNMFPTVSPVIEILLAQRRGAITPEEAAAQLTALENHDVRHDMKKYLLQPGINQQYSLSVSGGAAKIGFTGSIGFDKNRHLVVGNSDERFTLNLKSRFQPVKNLEITAQIMYTSSKDKGVDMDIINSFLPSGQGTGTAPYFKFVGEDGRFLHIPLLNQATLRMPYLDTVSAPGLLDWHYNPVEEIRNSSNKNDNHTTRILGTIKYTVLPGIALELSGAGEYAGINREVFNSTKMYYTRSLINSLMYYNDRGVPQYPVPMGGIMDVTNNVNRTYNLKAQLNIDKTFGRHQINAEAGGIAGQIDRTIMSVRFYGYDPKTLTYATNIDFVNAYITRPQNYSMIIPDLKNMRGTLNRQINYYSNIGYNLDNKYNLTASARVDGSNYFGVKANQRFKPFWSVGASWMLNKEGFFHADWVNALSLRATYGFNGNIDGMTPTMPVVSLQPSSQGVFIYNNYPLVGSVNTGNPKLTWERSGTANFAVDFSLFKNRLSGSVDYYFRHVTDLISEVRADITIGKASYKGNVGRMKSRGLDINLNGLLVNRAVRVSTILNIAFNREKIVDYYIGEGVLDYANSYLYGTPMPGKPLDPVYSYQFAGLDPSNGNPMGVLNGKTVPFTDVLGFDADFNPNTKPSDLVYHGSIRPLASGNMLNSISWKEFTFSFNITYGFGFYFRKASINYAQLRNAWSGHGDYARRWQQPGDEASTNIPSFGLDSRYDFYRNSAAVVRRGDYIYLQDANISWEAGKLLKNGIQAQLFINAKNLGLIWTANAEGLDPRLPHFRSNIPDSREIALGLNLNF